MLTLLEQTNHLNGTYFALQPSGGSRMNIEDLLYDLNVPNQENPLEYHLTVVYSKKPCPEMRDYRPILPLWGLVNHFELFGPNKDILVMIVVSDPIISLYENLQKYEPTTEYPIYRPHITVSKGWKGEVPIIEQPLQIKFDSWVCCAIDKDK